MLNKLNDSKKYKSLYKKYKYKYLNLKNMTGGENERISGSDSIIPKQISNCERHTMILTENGTIFACGSNEHGQLGMGDNIPRNTFTEVPPLPDGKVAIQVVTGDSHTLVLTQDGTVFACGNNEMGQTGLSFHTFRTNTFTEVPPLPDDKVAKQLIAGFSHTMILADDSTLFASGRNHNGQLGLGSSEDIYNFIAVPALSDGKVVKQVFAGGFHTMILAQDGTVFACGGNFAGQLGLGDNNDRGIFTAVTTLPEGKVVKQIITGLYTSMIVTEDNRMINANDVKQIFACGSNEYGQLGLGDNTHKSTFTAVSSLPDEKVVEQVVSGGLHTLCKAEDGTVFACGNNTYGQLGLADFDNNPSSFRETFAISSSLLNGQVIKEIVTGINQTFLLVSNTDGTNVRVLACGENDFGQLGLGDGYTATRNILTQVPLR